MNDPMAKYLKIQCRQLLNQDQKQTLNERLMRCFEQI